LFSGSEAVFGAGPFADGHEGAHLVGIYEKLWHGRDKKVAHAGKRPATLPQFRSAPHVVVREFFSWQQADGAAEAKGKACLAPTTQAGCPRHGRWQDYNAGRMPAPRALPGFFLAHMSSGGS
jgi:hypothetical protein